MSFGGSDAIRQEYVLALSAEGTENADRVLQVYQYLEQQRQEAIRSLGTEANENKKLLATIDSLNRQLSSTARLYAEMTGEALNAAEAQRNLARISKQAAEDERAASAVRKADKAAEADAEKAALQESLRNLDQESRAQREASQARAAVARANTEQMIADAARIAEAAQRRRDAEEQAEQTHTALEVARAKADQRIIADKIEANERYMQSVAETNQLIAGAGMPGLNEHLKDQAANLKAVADQEKENASLNKILEASERKLTDAELARADASVRQTDAFNQTRAAIEQRTAAEREAKAAADAMATADDRIAAATAAVNKEMTPEHLREYQAAMQQGAAAAVSAADADDRLKRAIQAANVAMDEAVGAAHGMVAADNQLIESEKKLAAAARDAGDASQQFSHKGQLGLIQVGYAIDDIQYGMRGVGNNLIQMAAQMGGAFAGSATIVVASASVIYNQWDNIVASLSEAIRTTGDDIESLKKRIKELNDNPIKVALDLTELDHAKQKLEDLESKRAAFESASKAMTDTQGKVAANVREAVVEHAGGTDLESGAANLAKSIADKQKQQGKFYTGEDRTAILNAENEAKRTKAAVDLMDPTADPMVQNELIRQQSAAQQKLEDLQRDAESKGMKRIQDELIGGALKGIDADRKRLLDTIEADPKFFAQRGIGDQFRADLITGSAANVRGQSQQAINQAREKRNAQSDKVVADAEKAKLNFEAANLNEQGKVNEQAGEQAQRDQKKAQTDRERAVNDAARKNAVAVEGKNQDLTRFINERLGAGDTPDQIVKRLAPQAGQRLGQVPGMDPALIADTAEKIVRDVIEKQAPLVVAEGGGAAGAAALNANLAGKNFDASNRVNHADQRRDLQSVENLAADRFAAQGANANQALALGHETARLVKSGLDFDRAMFQAYMNLTGQTRMMQHQQTQMMQQLQRTIRQQNRRPGGNNRPGRT